VANFLLYAATVLSWGFAWYAVKFQVGVVPPPVSVAYRFWIAALVMILWALARGSLRMPLRQHPWVALQGLFIFCTNFLLFYYGALYVTTGLLAVAISSAAVIVPLLNWIFRGQKVEPRLFVAAILGVGGVIVIFWPEIKTFELSDAGTVGMLFSLGGGLSFSIGSVINARNQAHGFPILPTTAWGMVYGASALSLFALVTGLPLRFETTVPYIGSLLFLSLLSTVLAFACYLNLVMRIGAGRAAYATVLFPVVALAVSTVMEGFQWTVLAALGMLSVLAGNLLVLAPRRRARAGDAAAGSA